MFSQQHMFLINNVQCEVALFIEEAGMPEHKNVQNFNILVSYWYHVLKLKYIIQLIENTPIKSRKSAFMY